ncbi:MAG: aryl-sulfate sulfotransferase [Candidatus Thiodiazotropha sp. (ex Dulcina madagascariensis)]|nr:aryl-sulfate sulfotransferase [Candidatus Thiodiazotropha sp. (ex Dulcina madagascariensis)]MCU7925457.1 aryl-sulfate sulfotransferase [Candidatus Thiodiazotropha sp. (ex Dulcina madagascariensis)]
MEPLSMPNGAAGSPLNKIHCRIIERIPSIKYLLFFIVALQGMLISTLAWPIEVTRGPSLTMNPNGVTPLAGVVQLATDVPARVTLTINDGPESWIKEFAEFQTDHYLPVLGLKPNRSYSIEITVTPEVGKGIVLTPSLQAVLDPLPVDFPNISVLISDSAKMEPGYTIIDTLARSRPGVPPEAIPDGTLPKYSIILDDTGEVVWYSTIGSRNMKQLPNGNISYRSGRNIIEMDLLGNVQQSIQFDYGMLHHDETSTTNGTILSLSRELVSIDGYPTSYTNPDAPTQTVTIEDNPVVEFLPDGRLLNKWKLSDMLDPTRIGYEALGIRPTGGFNWAHANAVLHDPSDDSIIVSVRNQDAVIKFSRSTGMLKWILANHDNWPSELQPFLLAPVGAPFEWQYHQHAPMITPIGTLLLFDNGNNRASPFDGKVPIQNSENYSRAVEYLIDEENMEVQQIWEYGTQVDQKYYTPSVGDADWMKNTGNILITYGNTMFVGGVSSNSMGMGNSHTRIVEVNHNTPAEKVFEVVIYNTTSGSRIEGYRSDRIPDLYPLDTDKDGVPDYQDNCVLQANGPLILDSGGNTQLDTDSDGFGNLCDADLNNDGMTNSLDLGLFKLAFFTNDTQPDFEPNADLNGDGVVNSLDLGIVKTLFSQPPGPSASTP